jgi:hypothetical protein
MIRIKATLGTLFFCACAMCALGAANASAAQTTAGECVSGGGNKDFKDAHCNEAAPAGTGAFGHVLFANGVKTNVTATNDLTGTGSVFKLEGTLAGAVVSITCSEVTAKGTVTNEAGGKATFGNAETEFEECKQDTPKACENDPVVVEDALTAQTGPHNLRISTTKKKAPTGEEITFHEENAGGNEMGLKFVPVGQNITRIAVECPILTIAPVRGFTYATPGRVGAANSSGATATFDKSSSIGGLTFAASPATLEGTLTFRKEGGNPLILTTTE